MNRFRFDDTDIFGCREAKGTTSEPVEVGDLSRRQIEPDRAVADLFSHDGGR